MKIRHAFPTIPHNGQNACHLQIHDGDKCTIPKSQDEELKMVLRPRCKCTKPNCKCTKRDCKH